ncbi:MAG: DNA alkylation repair protein, partial [bacterium]
MAGLSAENQFRNVFNMRVVGNLSSRIKAVYKEFDKQSFDTFISASLEQLSFGDRSKLIRQGLQQFLPKDFPKAVKILLEALDNELISEPGITDWDGFIIVPQTEYIAEAGIDHFDLAMKALYEMTKRLSSESAIRHFIQKYPEQSLALLKIWATDPNVHVRGLVS